MLVCGYVLDWLEEEPETLGEPMEEKLEDQREEEPERLYVEPIKEALEDPGEE